MSELLARRPTTRTVAADAVYERVRDAILSGELRPNARLVEEDLAANLGVSRSPVREALMGLTRDGLVVRSRGWAVRDHTPEEILTLLEARTVFETGAAYLGAPRVTGDQLDALRELATQMETGDHDLSTRNRLNRTFHEVVTQTAQNSVLDDVAHRTSFSYWSFGAAAIHPPADAEVVNSQHRDIIAALESRDPNAAQRAVYDHLRRTTEIVSEYVTRNQSR
ncbi:GntR family transcriptional regulator [Demequina flava]|uniref:GntR family transcriptional regulator n=1 Tax=Demequina flava TaxID=1095025 RepID=UPI0007810B25|nr:GntR family transcriptional regulator [Demequina flava]